jgi:hypothetical protein
MVFGVCLHVSGLIDMLSHYQDLIETNVMATKENTKAGAEDIKDAHAYQTSSRKVPNLFYLLRVHAETPHLYSTDSTRLVALTAQ